MSDKYRKLFKRNVEEEYDEEDDEDDEDDAHPNDYKWRE